MVCATLQTQSSFLFLWDGTPMLLRPASKGFFIVTEYLLQKKSRLNDSDRVREMSNSISVMWLQSWKPYMYVVYGQFHCSPKQEIGKHQYNHVLVSLIEIMKRYNTSNKEGQLMDFLPPQFVIALSFVQHAVLVTGSIV